MKINTKIRSKKMIPITIGILVVLLLGAATLYLLNKNGILQLGDQSNTTRETNSVDYSPPTQQEVDSSQDAKKNNGESDTPVETDTNSGKKSVNIGVSYAEVYENNVEVRAFTNGVIEGSGTCKATLKKGDHTISKTSKAFIDSSTSQCRPIYIPVSDFPEKGLWLLTVTYESPTSSGASTVFKVTV